MTRDDLIDNPDLLEIGLLAAADPGFINRLLGYSETRSTLTPDQIKECCFPESR